MKCPYVALKWLTVILWISSVAGQFDANFTLQNVWGRLQPEMRSLIQCLSDENHKKIKFSRVLDTGQGPRLPSSSQQFMQGKPVYARILFMPGEDKLNRFGAYQCKIQKQTTTTRIITLKLPPHSLAELDAVSPYLTVNVGEDVELAVNVTKKLELPVKWMHDGKELPDWAGQFKVRISGATPSHAGVYECFYEGRRGESAHALINLLVRGCPVDFFGNNCDQDCPPCYNGGVCHDKYGVCVCPAGFAGNNCEIPCGGNHFGADCSKLCSPTQNNSNTDELCALHLFCKPDPYGCSCAPGFKGHKCMEHCEPGWYGADCKQPCHCAYGISNCNRITGACEGGCARGWRGHSCQIEDPNSNSTYMETTTMVYCIPGTYGPSCERSCHCAGNEHCHIVTGHCSSGCASGWGGPTCGSCISGLFGENCGFVCHCEGGHHHCDKDGFCYSGCEAGWAGFTCQAECTAGRFGPNCASSCHCHENSTTECDRITGECDGDCEAGYMGKDCQTLCPSNSYGVNCVSICVCSNGAQCNRVDGTCACDGRWRGHTCNESEPQIVAATDEEVNRGQQVFLSCTVDAVPEARMNMSCSEFPDLQVNIRTLEQNQQQAVIRLKPEKSGVFEFLCTARNQHGFDMKKVTLTVVDPPRLTSAPTSSMLSNRSATVSWNMWRYGEDEGGLPTDRVEYLVIYKEKNLPEWTKVGSWQDSSSNPALATEIDGLQPNTVYEVSVRCRRIREGGVGDPGPSLEIRTECGVALPEAIPQEFLPEKITQTTVTLTWKNPPETLLRCPLVSYHMTYHPELEDTIMGIVDTEHVQTSIELEDLTPNTNYVVRLYPVTRLGESGFYAELIIRTSEMIPGPVSNLQYELNESNPRSIFLRWEPPSEIFGRIKGYTVTASLLERGQCGSPSNVNRTRHAYSDTNEFNIEELHPYSTYNISVQAITTAGEGDPVSEVVTTLESAPAQPPLNVRLLSKTNESLSFAWDPVECEEANGNIIAYDWIVYQSVDTTQPGVYRIRRSTVENTVASASVSDLVVSIPDLKPYTSYGFQIGGRTKVGRGILSDVTYHKTAEGVPGEPIFLSTVSVTDRTVQFSWLPPVQPNGVITRYRFKALAPNSVETFPDAVFTIVGEDGLSAVASNLKPATTYTIIVEAATAAGFGRSSSFEEITLDGAPGEPSEVSVTDNQQKSLNISWKEPREKNGAITGYKIRYQPIATLDPIFNSTPFNTKSKEVGNSMEAHLQGLHPSTQYRIAVSAKTSVGYGPEAEILCWTVILGDHVSPSLTLGVRTTNETIPIVFSTTGSSSVYKYQVIVEDARNREPIDESQLSDFETAVVRRNLSYYIAAELDPSNVSQTGEQTFVVGDRNVWGGYRNVHLNPGYKYKIRIRTLVIKDDELKSVLSETEFKTAGTMQVTVQRTKHRIFGMDLIVFILIVIGALVLLTAVTFITIVAVCMRRNRKESTNSFSTKDSGLSGSLTWSVMYKTPVLMQELDESETAFNGFRTLQLTSKGHSLKRSKSDSKIVHGLRVESLEDYLINAKSTNILPDEFKRLVDGQISPWTVARKSGNLKKNRYGNILPYDRHRVVLKTESSKSDTDYINASYIDGFRRPREYIVTQGPLDNTIKDFWRMIWQENCPVIVMITDLMECGKIKCSKYWPEDSMDCGDLHVLLIHSEQCKDFIVRTILVRKIDEIRTHRVVQYQYIGWQDRMIPSSSATIIKFVKKIRDDHPVMGGPMVVHCSAGAGRSGTYVAIDALCQQAAEDKRVDVFRFVNNSRHQRIHLVQTMEQYTFIYEALVEAIQFEDTSVPLERIRNYLLELNHLATVDRRSLILKQYNKLNRMQKKEDVNKCSDALSEVNIFKNRDPLTVPRNSARVRLETEDDSEESDYINAVFVDGYRAPYQFLVTQMPMTHTAEDFWRMIYQQRSSLIVMLNSSDENDDLNVGIYWPERDVSSFGLFEVQMVTCEEQGDIAVRIFRLGHKLMDEEPMKIVQLHYKGWTSEMKPSALVNLIEVTELWHERSSGGPIIVHCMDGATRCGLFVAAFQVCDQVETEGLLDAYHIVKNIRTNRSEFIPNSDQYRLLFEVAQEIAEPFLIKQQEENMQPRKKLSLKI